MIDHYSRKYEVVQEPRAPARPWDPQIKELSEKLMIKKHLELLSLIHI